MNPLDILIVDDERPARRKIRALLAGVENINSVDEAENGSVAAAMIKSKAPDLIFLDIQMPGLTGFEVIAAVGADKMPPVIFVTAYDEYAIEAFEAQAIDYLLKPFDEERFHKALSKAQEQIQLKRNHSGALEELLTRIDNRPKHVERIMVSKGQRFIFVRAEEILYVAANDKYVDLHTAAEKFLVRDTISRMEKRLDPDKFVRVHRSHIINLDFLKELQPWSHGDFVAVLKNGAEVPVSRRYRERLFSLTR